MTLLVGTYGARSTESLLRLVAGPVAPLCDVIEARLDYLPDADVRVADVVKQSGKPVMATCRRAGEGGAFSRGERARLDLLAKAADVGAAWIDVEDDVPLDEVRRLAGRGAKIVRSRHVPTLPEDADALVRRLLEPPADAAKLVPLRGTPADVVRLLGLVRAHAGRLGAHVSNLPFSRYAGAALGSRFTYASLRPGGLIPAPIPTVWTTVERMRLRRLREGAPLWILVGADVDRSVSPDMMNAAFESLGLPTVALRWSCDDPAPALEALERFAWTGLSVTMPHKERVFDMLRARGARIAASAEETGAVNTVLRDADGVLVGHNTDVQGIVDAIRPSASAAPVAGKTALVLGAGGAARAAVRAAERLGSRPIVVHARRTEAAERLAALRRDGGPEILVARTPDAAAAAAPALVVQATPAGAFGRAPVFDFATLPARALVLEMIVSPAETANHASAKAAGHLVVEGFHMLLHQAVEQVRLASGRAPDASVLRDVGAEALRRAGRTIILVGLRCTGKTEVGSRLARLLGLAFVDVDREVEARAGRSPDAMIRAGDEAAFRDVEARVLRDVLATSGAVVATGGGAVLHAELFAQTALGRPVVLLNASDDAILRRWAAAPRAALSDLPPREELGRQRAERMDLYRRFAWLELDATNAAPDAAAEALAALDDRDWTDVARAPLGSRPIRLEV